ncbi:MAG: glycosyltransferase family 39 protein [Candidatus Eisenbacteria sp.]|nr:glycosyltransferase family 39 protein [Candidatus Eisenbacteria bacterium]
MAERQDRQTSSLGTRRLRSQTVIFSLIVLAAWAARTLFLLRQQDHQQLVATLLRGDAPAFLHFAASMIRGTPHDSGIPFHPPGFPFFLSALLRLFGFQPGPAPPPAFALRMTMALTGALTCGLLYVLLKRLFGRGVALASLPLSLFSFGHYVQSTSVCSESFYLLLVVAVTLGLVGLTQGWERASASPAPHPDSGKNPRASLRTSRKPSAAPGRILGPKRIALAASLGLLAGWAALTRAEFILTAILMMAVLIRVGGRKQLRPAAAFLLVFLLTMIPWTVRCHQSIGAVNRANAARLPRPLPRLVLVTGYGPLNFATANNDFATGAFDTRLIDRLVPNREGNYLDLADPNINHLYIDGYRIGLSWMRDHPMQALALSARKIYLASHALALGYLQDDLPAGLSGERRPVDQFVPGSRWFIWVHLALLTLGFWRLARGRASPVRKRTRSAAASGTGSQAWLFMLPHAITTLLVIVGFFGYVRLGLLLAPVLWAMEGAGLLALAEVVPWPTSWRRHPGRIIAAGIVGILLLEAAATASGPRSYVSSGPMIPGTGRINPDELVQIRARR